jgi:hypothetical protein
MSESDFASVVRAALDRYAEEEFGSNFFEVLSFEEAGVLTYNEGLVVACQEGTFQVTIVRSRDRA